MPSLFDPIVLGTVHCANRIVMAPLTRNRSRQPGNIPWELNATYYAQRATMGLIVSEATQISPQGQGYLWAPGIHSEQQVAGWSQVTDAVHAAGGRMVLQLWHVGRISHASVLPAGSVPVSPSGVAGKDLHTWAMRDDGTPGRVACTPPREMTAREIRETIDDYAVAAANAMRAGFDGVEIHGANGYLIEQFLDPTCNLRTDEWGGSLENRARFALEAYRAVSGRIGAQRTGIRLSPGAGPDGVPADPHWRSMALHLASGLRGAMYVHLFDRTMGAGQGAGCGRPFARDFRDVFGGPVILNGGFGPADAQPALDAGQCDMVAFGRAAISNPDLVQRLCTGAELAPWNTATFYGGDAHGYTDYPSMQKAVGSSAAGR